MDISLESFNCRKQRKIFEDESKIAFSKNFQNEFQNAKLSKEDPEFQKSRFSFYQQKILNLSQNLRQMISLKVQATSEAKQEHIM